MAQGFESYNADGSSNTRITDRLTRILGTIGPVSAAGAITVPAFAQGTPWTAILQRNTTGGFNPFRCIQATVSGTTLSWNLSGLAGWAIQPATIVYGVY
ncbi:hypothetical protein [Pseudomonas xantholysinigenes]|jgi:hypothetical protein|uniref:Uncharacterized protein n=1 Tax=Pseudomonas xantholysinigenes TaxID=2745490 RepID=A0A9E6PV88_9PSED|nr:hypothetical protein [Pseudomonas xantholysinigenes]QXI37353.1 hypothetical protein HU772_018715 [Pseudomonas xantholysinigenes]